MISNSDSIAARWLPVALLLCVLISGPLGRSDDSQSPGPYTSDAATECRHLARGLVPDGDLAQPQWNKAKWVRFNQSYLGDATYPQAGTEVACLWTKEHIYFGFRAHYTALNTYEGEDPAIERWKLWERDVVEVFVNPRPGHVNIYYEFEVAPNNQWLDLDIDLDRKPYTNESWNSGFKHATRVDEKAKVWTCEFRIPLVSMKVASIQAGETWRINFYRMDGKESDGPRRLMSWSTISPPHNGYHTPQYFGMIRFQK